MQDWMLISYIILVIAACQKFYAYFQLTLQDGEAFLKRYESMRLFILFTYLILVIICLGFAALNANPVTLKLYWISLELPLAFIMVLCLAAGLILGAILFLGKYLSLKHSYKKAKGQVGLLEKEIKNLRAIPIQDSH
jgi:putative membrane protein